MDGGNGHQERGDAADQKAIPVHDHVGCCHFQQFYRRRQHDNRNRQQEGKPRGGFPGHAKEQAGGDGDARAGGAGDQSHGLGDANDNGVFPVQGIHGALAFGEPVGDAQQDAEHQSGEEDHRRAAQFVVDHVEQGQAGEAGGDGADHQVPGQGALADDFALAHGNQAVPGDAEDIPAEVEHHRQQCAHVHRQVKADALVFPAKEGRCQDQVGGAGYGQEFGQSLEEAKEKGLENIHSFNSGRWC